MKKINTYVNIANFLAAIVSLFSGIVIWKILPSGQGFRGGRGELESNLFWGIARHDWMDIHTVSSLIFVGLVILHLILHWYWIKNLPKIIKE
jgi:hypothetical protein